MTTRIDDGTPGARARTRAPARAVACAALIGCAATVSTPARAVLPVTDAGAILQLVQQFLTLQQQLSTARAQLARAEDQLRATTGGRGMERLLAGTPRRYLPADWASLAALARSPVGYPALAARIRSELDAIGAMDADALGRLAPDARAHVTGSRLRLALARASTAEALVRTAARFDDLQHLVDAIGAAGDPKAVLDLQARIAAEQTLLQNEQTKLALYDRAAAAEAGADELRTRELALAGHGRFAVRFRPTPR